MIEVRFSNRNKTYHLPDNWAEVTPIQLYQFIRILHQEETIEAAKLKILQKWMDIGMGTFTGVSIVDAIQGNYQINDFLLTDIEDKLIPFIDRFFSENSFEKNLLPTLTIPGRRITYYGYSDRLESVTAGEFAMAVFHYDTFISSGNLNDLRKFVATLYRPKRTDGVQPGDAGWNGDLRVPYNENNILAIAEELENIDPYWLYAVKFNWERILTWYGELPSFDAVFPTHETRVSTYTDWDRIIHSIAGDKRGQVLDVRSMPIFELFQEIQYLEEEREAVEERLNSKFKPL